VTTLRGLLGDWAVERKIARWGKRDRRSSTAVIDVVAHFRGITQTRYIKRKGRVAPLDGICKKGKADLEKTRFSRKLMEKKARRSRGKRGARVG